MSEGISKPEPYGYPKEEYVNIKPAANDLLLRMATMSPRRYKDGQLYYSPKPRMDTQKYVKLKTASARTLTNSQQVMHEQLRMLRRKLENMDDEVLLMQEELWGRARRNKYRECSSGVDFAYRYKKYNASDFRG